MSSRYREEARVMNWQRDVARSLSDPSNVPASPKRSTRRKSQSQTATVVITQSTPSNIQLKTVDSTMSSSKALIGTLIGAVAGATVAYAMTKAEAQDDVAAIPAAAYQVRALPEYNVTPFRPSSRRSSAFYQPQPIYDSSAMETGPSRSPNTPANTITNLISSMEISPAAPASSRSTIYAQPPATPYAISEPSTANVSEAQTSRSAYRQHQSSNMSTSQAPSKKGRSERLTTISHLPYRDLAISDDVRTVVPTRRTDLRSSHRSGKGEDHLTPSDSISQASSSLGSSSGSRRRGRKETSGRTSKRYEEIEW